MNLERTSIALIVVGLLFLLLFVLQTCNKIQTDKQRIEDLGKRINELEKSTHYLKNENGALIALNNQIKTESGRDIEKLTDSIFQLKRADKRSIKSVSNYTRISQAATVTGKTAKYNEKPGDTARATAYQPTDTTNLMRVPRPFTFEDSTVFFEGTVTKEGVTLDTLTIPNTLHIRTVNRRGGLFKNGSTEVQAVNSNPAFKTSGIASVEVKHKPNFWNRWAKPVLALAAGIFIGTKAK